MEKVAGGKELLGRNNVRVKSPSLPLSDRLGLVHSSPHSSLDQIFHNSARISLGLTLSMLKHQQKQIPL